MATLYDIIKSIESFEFEVDEETGEILNMAELDALQVDKETKVENIALFIKNLKADAAMYADEEKAFAQRKKAAANKADRLTKYLAAMLAGEKYKSARVAITWKPSEAVNITSIDELPQGYYVTEKKPDKMKIRQAIKNGEQVPGAVLVERENIQVK